MSAKEFTNRFPLDKLNRKRDFKRGPPQRNDIFARRTGRGERDASRRGMK